MGKIRFLWDNLVDGATVTANSSAAGFPVTNLQHPWYLKTHRTTGVAAEWWKFDLGTTPDPVQYFVWYYHNIENDTSTALRIQASNDPAEAWVAPALNEVVIWHNGQLTHFFATPQTYRFWRFYAEDPGNADGYLRCGRPYLGSYFQPTYNFYSKKPRLHDPSEKMYSSNRQMSANKKDVYDIWDVTFDNTLESDYTALREMYLAVGTNLEYFVVFDSADANGTLNYVLNSDDWEFDPIVHENYGFAITIEEAG
jgi:hypothetical protein